MSNEASHGDDVQMWDDELFTIVGYSCKLFKDPPSTAVSLVPWFDNTDNMMDRHDCRLLIDDERQFRKQRKPRKQSNPAPEEDNDEANDLLANDERWLFLPLPEVDEEAGTEPTPAEVPPPPSAEESPPLPPEPMPTLPQLPEHEIEAPPPPPLPEVEEVDFCRGRGDPKYKSPEGLPIGIITPATVRMYRIIRRTARFIAVKGPDAESIMLQRYLNHPHFTFLHFSHRLHAFYLHLLTAAKESKLDASDDEASDLHLAARVLAGDTTFEKLQPPNLPERVPITQPEIAPEEETTEPTQVKKGVTKTKIPSDISTQLLTDNPTHATPPTELQVIIDRTALSVAQHGDSFKKRLIGEKNNPTFSFLDLWDQHHQYYKTRLNEAKEALATARDLTSTSDNKQPDSAEEESLPPPAKRKRKFGSKADESNPDTGVLSTDEVQAMKEHIASVKRDLLLQSEPKQEPESKQKRIREILSRAAPGTVLPSV